LEFIQRLWLGAYQSTPGSRRFRRDETDHEDERARGAVVRRIGFGRTAEFRNDPLGKDLAELDAPLTRNS
jgi:hypothetical protein